MPPTWARGPGGASGKSGDSARVLARGHTAAVRTLVLFLALFVPTPLLAQDDDAVLVGTVTKVVDAATLDVELDSGQIRVRLYSTDTPENGTRP